MRLEEIHHETQLVHALVERLAPAALLPLKQAANELRCSADGDEYVFAQIVCSETNLRMEQSDA